MTFIYSFWERESFARDTEVAVIGGGIVGINAAISLKEMEPDLEVLVIDSSGFPLGASTRNAGFACFGSVTELLDDLEVLDKNEVLSLLDRRLNGLKFLKKRVGKNEMNYQDSGGYEVFNTEVEVEQQYSSAIKEFNHWIKEQTGLEHTYEIKESKGLWKNFNHSMIYNKYEGSLHPGKMMEALYQQAQKKGVRFLMGTQVSEIENAEEGKIKLKTSHGILKSNKLLIATNGFSHHLFPSLEVKPARNQVLVTEPIDHLKFHSCYHYDKGYVYFRAIKNRILIGGGRNTDAKTEEISQFGTTSKIKDYLKDVLYERIGCRREVKIEFEWSGIMGVGEKKSPILQKRADNLIFAVRLGGMGVALGSSLGDQAAKLLLKDTTF